MPVTEVRLRRSGDGYVTGTVQGKRASCSWSDAEAVKRLGAKLYGDKLRRVDCMERYRDQGRLHSRWQILHD
ncbi:hypothetical protein [Halomonas saccharevitans]|uniref:Uncharacterized protein n=1 Tax=Halomonas saccharevitans TaxID=416872 RepID=A0A1I7AGV8_9GAMM|nr:hypothetical protein [Halomonas saccharevitans]SFT74179.1 hypothetical protein SAMN04487956_11774 [Halomonas saccharevitans]